MPLLTQLGKFFLYFFKFHMPNFILDIFSGMFAIHFQHLDMPNFILANFLGMFYFNISLINMPIFINLKNPSMFCSIISLKNMLWPTISLILHPNQSKFLLPNPILHRIIQKCRTTFHISVIVFRKSLISNIHSRNPSMNLSIILFQRY